MTAKPPRPPATIRIRTSEGTEADVSRLGYINAKTVQLKGMGYGSVTKKAVRLALDHVIAQKKHGGPIALEIENDIIITIPPAENETP